MDVTGSGDERGEIVGQNVKLELIRAHRGASEWLIVIGNRLQGGTIWALCNKFTSQFSSFSLTFPPHTPDRWYGILVGFFYLSISMQNILLV